MGGGARIEFLPDPDEAFPKRRRKVLVHEIFDRREIGQARGCAMSETAIPSVQMPQVAPFEQRGCRAQRIHGKACVVEARCVVHLRQAFPVLHDPLGPRGLASQQAQVGFQDIE
jgi:hypothetical protein